MPKLATRPAPRIEPRHRRPSEPALAELSRTRRALPLLVALMVLLPTAALMTPRSDAAPAPAQVSRFTDGYIPASYGPGATTR